jgi:hypothetical protein
MVVVMDGWKERKKERKTDGQHSDRRRDSQLEVWMVFISLGSLRCCDGEIDGWPGRVVGVGVVGVATAVAVDLKEC